MQSKEITTGTLLWAAIKSLRYKRMNKEMVGWRRHVTTGPIDLDSMQAFARAIGDNNDAYFRKDPIAPPFFLVRLIYPLLASAMLNPKLRMNLFKMVHGDMYMNWHKPIRPGDQLDLDLEAKSISDTSAGEILHLEVCATLGGEKVMDATAGLLVRGKKKASKKGAGNKEQSPKQESFRIPIETHDGQQLQYAEVSGDHNFIHTNYLLARLAGLPRTIMHGMCVMAMTSASLVNHLAAGDPTKLRQIGGRFASPVIPGQTLSVVAYDEASEGSIPFEVLTPSGKTAIKNGTFTVSS